MHITHGSKLEFKIDVEVTREKEREGERGEQAETKECINAMLLVVVVTDYKWK